MPLSASKTTRRATGRSAGAKSAAEAVVESKPKTATAVVASVSGVPETQQANVLMQELGRVEQVVADVLVTKDIKPLFAYGKLLHNVEGVTGVTKMHLLHLIQKNWEEWVAQGLVGDDWQNVVRAEIGVQPSTAKKYVRAWQTLMEDRALPDSLRKDWEKKPVEHWTRIMAVADRLNIDQWKAATIARHGTEIAEIAKAARGGKARTSSGKRITLRLRRKTGEIQAWQGSGTPIVIGTLKLDARSQKNPLIVQAQTRIIAAAGIVEE